MRTLLLLSLLLIPLAVPAAPLDDERDRIRAERDLDVARADLRFAIRDAGLTVLAGEEPGRALARMERRWPPGEMYAFASPAVFAQAGPAAVVAEQPTIAEPTPEDLMAAVKAKAWPLVVGIAIFIGAKIVTALGWVTSKSGKLALVVALGASSAGVDALFLGQHWLLALIFGVTAGLAAVGINSGGKNVAEAMAGSDPRLVGGR